jgi:hypothetical protein
MEKHRTLSQPHAVLFKLVTSSAGDLNENYLKLQFRLPTSKWVEEEGSR